MTLSRTFQVILGILIGLAVLASAGAAVGYLFLSRLGNTPPKPIFSEEVPPNPSEPEVKRSAIPASSPQEPKTEEQPSEKPSPEQLEPGAYKARVTWSEGLSLRDEPNPEANRIGGVAYNEELIVIKVSEDGKWEKVRVPGSDAEGWIKAGNVEKTE